MGTYKVKKGDRDCSASVIDALKTAGIPVGNASYTGNMRSEFLKTGVWEWKPMSYTAHRGDVYLSEGHHTAMCSAPLNGRTSPDMLLEFSHDEKGGYYNGNVGDQLNNAGYAAESHERPYYSYPWHGILHYIGKRTDLLEDAVQIMEHLVKCPEHGYTMSAGRTGSSGYCTVTTTGTKSDGWERASKGWVYFENGNQIQNGWKKIKGEWYYFEDGYAVQEKLIEWNGHKYYLETNCDMITGWAFIDGWRYFRPKNDGQPLGSMVTGQYTINGKKYNFDSDGKLI